MRVRKMLMVVAVSAGLSNVGLRAAAAVVVGAGGTNQTFDTAPGVTEFSTAAVGAGSADYGTTAQLDAAVATLTAGSVTTALPGATGTPTTNALAVFNSDSKLISTAPTGNGATVLLGTFQNTSGASQAGFNVSYTLGLINNNVTTGEELPGQRVYYSTTGLAGSFLPVGSFGVNGNATTPAAASQVVSFSVSGTVANNGTFYLAFADDNAATNPDAIYTIDNLSVTPAPAPEPATLGFLGLGGVGLLARRRRGARR